MVKKNRKIHWRNWAPYQKCVDIKNSKCLVRRKKPRNLSYEGISSYGTHYYRKTDNSFWVETIGCGPEKSFLGAIFVKVG